jgi:HEAT repeat protein
VEPLIAALRDKNANVREEVAGALRRTKDPRAIEPLIASLKDEDSDVRHNAARALKKVTGQDFGQDPEKWQEWWEENKDKFLSKEKE